MKKLLALVLALVMVMGLSVVSTNAATFADADKIEHTQAVEVLNLLGVLGGKENNNFDPTGNVKRSEMAKMIAIAMLGADVEVSAFQGAPTDLTDIDGHWAEGYIKYCVSQGIVGGRGNGKFDPDANVTASEAAKMLLVAIGYNSTVQGYTGDQWKINVTRDAQLADFYDDLKVTADHALTRDETAQMVYNAIGTQSVSKTATLTVNNGQVAYEYNRNDNPLMWKTFRAQEYIGLMAEATYSSNNKKYTYYSPDANFAIDSTGAATSTTWLDGYTFTNKTSNSYGSARFDFTADKDYSDLKGKQVDVVFTTAKNGTRTVLGIYDTGKTTSYTTALSGVTVDGKKLKFEGTSYSIDTVNGPRAGVATTNLLTVATANWYNSTAYVSFFDWESDGDLDFVGITETNPGKVSYVSSTEIIAGGKTYKYADNTIADGLKVGDYVTAIEATDGSFTVAQIEMTSGKVTAVQNTDSRGQVMSLIGGTWYNNNNGAGNPLAIDQEYQFAAVNNVVIPGSIDRTAASIARLIMVLSVQANTWGTGYEIFVMDDQGVTKTVALDETGAGVVTYTPLSTATNELYSYVETSKGYRLYSAANTVAGITDYNAVDDGTYNQAAGAKTVTKGGSTLLLDDSAKVFVRTTNGGTVMTGKQFKALNPTGWNATWTNTYNIDTIGAVNNASTVIPNYITAPVDGVTRVVYMAAGYRGTTSSLSVNSSANYAFVVSNPYTVGDGYASYEIFDGATTQRVTDKGNALGTFMKGDVVAYSSVTDGEIKDANMADTYAGAILSYTGGKVYMNTTTGQLYGAKVTNDTKVIYIDSNASSASAIGMTSGGEIAKALENTTGVYAANVLYGLDGGGNTFSGTSELNVLIVDVKGLMTVPTTAANANNETKTLDRAASTTNVAGVTANWTAATDAAQMGQAVTLTITNSTATAYNYSVALTNAYYNGVAGGSPITGTLAAGASMDYTVIVTGNNFGAAVTAT